MKLKHLILPIALVAATAHAQVAVKHIQTEKGAIATGVWAGDTYYLSGQLASPITPADAAKGTPADYGDTKAQAASVFAKIQTLLKEQGLDMKDVVKMTVFLGPDPKTGKLDFARADLATSLQLKIDDEDAASALAELKQGLAASN